jgi:hypothetical protein
VIFMPVLSITETYANGNVPTKLDLDSAFNSVATFFNVTGLDSTNFQTGVLTGSNFAAGSIGTAQIANQAVTSSKLAANCVTPQLRAPANIVYSQSSGIYTNATTTFTNVCSLTIVTTGRPVALSFQSDGSGNALSFGYGSGSGGMYFQIQRNSTAISTIYYLGNEAINPTYYFIDTNATAESNIYSVVASSVAGNTAKINYGMLCAYEL